MRAILRIVFGTLFLAAIEARGEGKLFEYRYRSVRDLHAVAASGVAIAGVDRDRKTYFVYSEDGAVPVAAGTPVAAREVPVVDARYTRYDVLRSKLAEWQDARPDVVRVERLGWTHEGREVLAVRLGPMNVARPRPAVLVDAMHHAREVMTTEVALDLVETLVDGYPTDPDVRRWLNAFDVWVVPMVNPDGNERVHTRVPMWRKNTKGTNGVDLNRNYPTKFGRCRGSSGDPRNETYRGPGRASEEETRHLLALAERIRPTINLSYHTFSEMVLWPMGCPNDAISSVHRGRYLALGRGLASRLVRDSGRVGYAAGTSYQLLYPTDGVSIDHLYRAFGTMAFVLEVNSSRLGFQPSYDWRAATVRRQRAGWRYVLNEMLRNPTPLGGR